ncbi:D-alanyl-D-alanine carboxypeptidase family protein [Paenibacillus radicis (ex Gao et al. 2016)]|uniref:D-alanyl-D-alanine carboxypeptidase n=1 Tax=Paenibacillus radicis (ex Gao et al. 2016) TaxID=1737354 RepID=A0A917GQH5_9BACL|nr:D-alanyl-D-alanine carboxypeptidase family protein [Paenibacillus radicis (ex Gao et al. 2016)]GGG54405.1 D-alanyl-D-alanine carboxypeptidase [Paenibacillus radicis (ex Gao et al. 2016)]
MIKNRLETRKPDQLHDGYVRLKRSDIHKGKLLLVNRSHPVRSETNSIVSLPADILRADHSEEPFISLELECSSQLSRLLGACMAKEQITVVSGYRSAEMQQRIYEESVAEHGEAFTNSYVAVPGASEHQTGLAVDVGVRGGKTDYIRPSFAGSAISDVFRELAPEYGFIQRYQEGKEAVTGIACEPWHYRYVGFPHSAVMVQYGLCLEEYIAFLKRFPYGVQHLYFGDNYEIYYVKAEAGERLELPIPHGDSGNSEWSGNNEDGFIVTVCARGKGGDDVG